MTTVRIDSDEIFPAQVEGSQNVFKTTKFVLCKPAWVSDESVSTCAICSSKFNQIRRRHHCRCCGKVLCSKCCSNRIPCPQYLIETPERVCQACVPVVTCVTMSHSNEEDFHTRSVTSLETLCRDNPASVVLLGGVHTLVHLARLKSANNMETMKSISRSFHSLSLHSGLVDWLAIVGVMDAVVHVLRISSSARDQSAMATEALNTLRIFVKTSNALKRQAVHSGCIPPLLSLTESDNPSISLIAMTTLSLIAELSENHGAILNEKNALRKLLTRISMSKDDKEVEMVLKIMMLMSAGKEETKHIIVCEDTSVGSVIPQALKSRSGKPQIVANTACTIANLATSTNDQVGLQSSLQSILFVLTQPYPGYVVIHFVRALGNFAKHEIHANIILKHLQSVLTFLDLKWGSKLNSHAVKCVFNLLKHRKTETTSQICRYGAENLFSRLSELDLVMDDLLRSLDRAAVSVET